MPREISSRPVTCDPACPVAAGRSSQPCARAELLGVHLYFIEENFIQSDFEHSLVYGPTIEFERDAGAGRPAPACGARSLDSRGTGRGRHGMSSKARSEKVFVRGIRFRHHHDASSSQASIGILARCCDVPPGVLPGRLFMFPLRISWRECDLSVIEIWGWWRPHSGAQTYWSGISCSNMLHLVLCSC